MKPKDITHFDTPQAFRSWLQENHATRDELWAGFWKKSSGRPSITWEESVDEALCFGWIDGIRKSVDDSCYTIRFTPRRSGSIWSLRNIERYSALEKAGKVESQGAATFANRTKDNSGKYSFEQEVPVTLSQEFLDRLQSDAKAWADWNARPPGYKKQVSHWVMSAKLEKTRERRLTTLIEDCAAGRKVKPLRL
jgi:uncharacterized protein YdeI (YjbR/CyaY-like superfamily)